MCRAACSSRRSRRFSSTTPRTSAEFSAPEQARARHILIKVAAGADAKTDAAAKAKAEELLKQIQGGANFADLAKKNSDDPGSKDAGGELGFAQRGTMVPEFDNAIFTQKIGDIADREDRSSAITSCR